MADLRSESASMSKAIAGISHATGPLERSLSSFRAASHDLSAFGALGSLLKATGAIRDGMDELSGAVSDLHQEWQAQGSFIEEVGRVFDKVDRLLEEASRNSG